MAENLIPIYIMGKRYEVPESLTIMKAIEYAGYKLIRGCGCRGGFCGACATVYRVEGDPRLYRRRIGLDRPSKRLHRFFLVPLGQEDPR